MRLKSSALGDVGAWYARPRAAELSLVAAGLLMALATVPPVAAAQPREGGLCEQPWLPEPIELPAAMASPPDAGRPFVVPPIKGPAKVRTLKGEWRRIADAPFPTVHPVSIWTGKELVFLDPTKRRAAAYHPGKDRWREFSRPPEGVRTDGLYQGAWTGKEFIALGHVSKSRDRLGGFRLDPKAGKWTKVAEYAGSVGSVADSVWTGDRVVLLTSLGRVVAYDPDLDCWSELPSVPGEGRGEAIYRDGTTLIAQSRIDDGRVSIHAFETADGAWGDPVELPLNQWHIRGEWHDGDLVFATWGRADPEAPGTRSLVYDPAERTWAALEHACRQGGVATYPTERLWVADGMTRALDPATWRCYRIPERPVGLHGGAQAWTGEELIHVSGTTDLLPPSDTVAYAFRPPRWLTRPAVPDDLASLLPTEVGGRYFAVDPEASRRVTAYLADHAGGLLDSVGQDADDLSVAVSLRDRTKKTGTDDVFFNAIRVRGVPATRTIDPLLKALWAEVPGARFAWEEADGRAVLVVTDEDDPDAWAFAYPSGEVVLLAIGSVGDPDTMRDLILAAMPVPDQGS